MRVCKNWKVKTKINKQKKNLREKKERKNGKNSSKFRFEDIIKENDRKDNKINLGKRNEIGRKKKEGKEETE